MIATVPNLEAQNTGNSQRRNQWSGALHKNIKSNLVAHVCLCFSNASPSGIRLEYEKFTIINNLIFFPMLLAHLEDLILPTFYKLSEGFLGKLFAPP